MHEIPASAAIVSTIAKRRADCTRSMLWPAATLRARPLYCRITFAVQNIAVVLSAVFGFVLDPCSLTSLNASTHAWLWRDGGGGGRTRSVLSRMNGRTLPTHGVCGAAN